MKIPLKYSIRNFKTRRLTIGLTVLGVALVVFVFAAVLMLSYGVKKTLVATGSDENVIIVRKAANAEITSIIDRESAGIVKTMSNVAKLPDGKPLASGEVVVVINLLKIGSNDMGNVTVRGVAPEAFTLRPQVKLVDGRMFRWGLTEIIVGSSIAKRFQGAQVGQILKFGGVNWSIVGIFDSGGSGFDSEIWGDVDQLMPAFDRPVFSSLTFRLEPPDGYEKFLSAFDSDRRLQYFDAKREKQFYEEQSELMAMFIRILGLVVTIIFSAGAMIGAMITMYAAVANRTVEIGTLRALGFRRRNILTAFLLESLLLALIGGVVGLFFAAFLQFFTISTINFGSFSELAFGFALSPSIIFSSLVFSVFMGLIGGFLPAVRAARLNIVNALRAS
jgi:ABC-type lipoprotein release transport system permease subunit